MFRLWGTCSVPSTLMIWWWRKISRHYMPIHRANLLIYCSLVNLLADCKVVFWCEVWPFLADLAARNLASCCLLSVSLSVHLSVMLYMYIVADWQLYHLVTGMALPILFFRHVFCKMHYLATKHCKWLKKLTVCRSMYCVSILLWLCDWVINIIVQSLGKLKLLSRTYWIKLNR